MNLSEASFEIIEDNNCPLYEMGDEFKLSGSVFVLPRDKIVCLILAEDIINLGKCERSENFCMYDNEFGDVFDCSGCTGLIRLSYKKGIASIESGSTSIDDNDIGTIASLLGDFSFFQTFGENEIKKLVSYLKLKKFDNLGELIIRKGDPGTRLFIILFGRVEVVGEDGLSIAFLGKGEVFGEMSLLSGEPVGAAIKVVDPTTILYIERSDFRKVLEQFSSLQMYFARLLAQRLQQTNVNRTKELAYGMVGKLSEMQPSELFQTLNTTQKTGLLALQLSKGSAGVAFNEGSIVGARYQGLKNEEAFYEILRETEGRFKLTPDLPPEYRKTDEIGDFMGILMEGIRRMDEDTTDYGMDEEEVTITG
ncbi:MAG: hypothetical protein B6245_00365 [Desulfobacteraceae bacterium 4572_88]|nr:MAG: hypothetical protein B6245_00365 [Desulfobacteraceae bacterium 4572_88]